MKTERFATIVAAAGKPVPHLLLISPEKDKALQSAIKSRRIMTVHQTLVGNKADYGNVGFEPGTARQYLIFPKSLSKFEGTRVVGIKYELLENGTSDQRAKPAKAAKKEHPPKKQPKREVERQEAPPEKVVHFTTPEPPKEPDEESETLSEIKNQVRQAMEALEQGKQIAAFNLLKRIVER